MVSLTWAIVAMGQQPTAPRNGAGQPPGTPESPAPTPMVKLEGAMRVEHLGVMDYRASFVEPAPERAPKPALRVLVRLTGERLGDLYRCGRAIVEEMSDDTGARMFDPTTISEKDRTVTTPVNLSAGIMQQGYHMLDITALPGSRAAKTITRLRGYVNIVFGGHTEEITIENPLQYLGKTVDHPKLKEIGLTVRVLKMGGEEATEPNDGRGIALDFEPSDEQVKAVDFYDENMKKIAARPRDGKSEKVDAYKYYALAGGLVNADTQMVLTVLPKIEKQRIEFDLKDIPLP